MQLTVATLSLVLAIFSFATVAGFVAVRHRKAQPRAALLAAFLLAMTATLLNFVLFASGAVKAAPALAFLGNTVGLAAAPLLFLYAESMADPAFTIRRRAALHFLPVLIVLAIVVGDYTLAPRAEKMSILYDGAHASLINAPLLQVSIFAYVFAYLAATIRLIARHRGAFREFHSAPGPGDLRWLQIAVIGVLGVWTASLVHQAVIAVWPLARLDRIFANGLAVSAFAFGFYFLVHALRQTGAAPASGPPPDARDDKYGAQRLSDKEVEAFAAIVEQHLAKSNAHLETALTLDDLARALPMTARELSQTLNRHYGKTFFEFINDRRIARAVERLNAEPDAPITTIMGDCGFASKSSFYAEFKKRTGKTPSQFRRAERTKTENAAEAKRNPTPK